jgi:excisionase family DNA binding protein|tara:strand:+ start:30 stop:233 length:204 start_codon:yes stop_codon:yes gene_type:complete
MDKYLTPREVAEQLNISRETVLRRIRTGKLNALKIGNRVYRISETDLEKFLQLHKTDSNSREKKNAI